MCRKGNFGGRAAVLAVVIASGLFCSGCGDVFRPVAYPVLQPGGDPQLTAHALVVSTNGTNQGAALVIDVSGDTAAGILTVGRNPVQATFISGTDYVVNQADHNVNAFNLPVPGSQQNASNNIITLPGPTPSSPNAPSASPVFAAPAGGKLFVTEPGLVPPMVADVSPASLSVSTQIPVGNNPVALVATPDGTQLYCLNHDDSSVTVILPATDQVATTIQLPGGMSPVWGAVSADGTSVFVVNQGSNNVSVIDTASDTVFNTLPVGPEPNYITYDPTLNRAYVTSPAGNSLSIINNNTGTVQTIPMASGACNGQHPISVTALADGTRAYVADDVTSSVCVLNTTNNTFALSIQVDAGPIGIASNSDATRVYTANQGAAAVPIASISRVSNPTTGIAAVTVTTTGNNPFAVGQLVTIAGVADSTLDGQYGITSVNSPTQFVYSQTCTVPAQCPTSSSSGGTAAIPPDVSIIQTSGDTTVKGSDGVAPLTIPAGGTPTFITMTP